ncbi:hypothetical protein A7978_04725 (plasmid) [Borrelia turicatae]|nr:hypothetical protein [Borrelia turicatae]ANF34417.1 hypothetical protein A7978_04725 [Borrelia turicatae]UPA14001.1 hypothetical protein bt91E135_001165 [Borrelia turicatae 91E135]UPA15494.1 hypothetical protein btBTE5EL_001176 [Borrelia turicatae]
MFIRFTLIISRIFSFYVLGIFLLSADFKTYCDKENFYCHKEYLEDFKSGSISRILFIKSEIMEAAKINLRETIMKTNEEYGKAIEAGSPDYSLEFKIVGDYRAVNIKQVIFDGVEAEPSIFHLFEPSWQLAEIKDFHMGPSSVNKRFLGVIFPVPVSNTFTIHLRKRLVDKLKERPRIKITLISVYDDEFVIETDNFIKKYDF